MRDMPQMFAIFHRNFPGDEALLRLFRARFEAAGLGAEIYPANLGEALDTWQFVPRTYPRHMVHLPRHWDVFAAHDRQQMVDMALALAGRARGLVLHDREDWFRRRAELVAVLGELDGRLAAREQTPIVFVEYAAGLELDDFASLVEDVQALAHVSACIDTGHVTVFTARRRLSQLFPEVNPDEPATLADLPHDRLVSAAGAAEGQAREALFGFAARLGRLGKTMHVHLHDGHLFSRWSIFPVSDHTPIGVDAGPSKYGHPLLGQKGVTGFLRAISANLGLAQLSITLEIHPGRRRERRPLAESASLFAHWSDLAQAEMTNEWIALLLDQQDLVKRICAVL
jgi:hypothetical protein